MAIATRIDDITGRGETRTAPSAQRQPRNPSRALDIRGTSFAHAGIGLPQDSDFSVGVTQKVFTDENVAGLYRRMKRGDARANWGGRVGWRQHPAQIPVHVLPNWLLKLMRRNWGKLPVLIT